MFLGGTSHPCLNVSSKWDYKDVIWHAGQKGDSIICSKMQWKDFPAFCALYFCSDRSINFPTFVGKWPRAA